jgi:hypothetical protein
MEHPAEETLRRFRTGKGSPAENREVVAHLLRGCKICSEIVREAIQPETPSARERAAESADDPQSTKWQNKFQGSVEENESSTLICPE